MITVSLASSVPLHDQIVTQLRRLIATGVLGLGDELPPVRQLANDLGINLNTVARAYRELTDAGLLASARGRGTVVIATLERGRGTLSQEKQRIATALGAALADAKIAGFSQEETRDLVDAQIAKLWNNQAAKP